MILMDSSDLCLYLERVGFVMKNLFIILNTRLPSTVLSAPAIVAYSLEDVMQCIQRKKEIYSTRYQLFRNVSG